MILNSLRMYNLKYRDEYGQMIVCCDSGAVWRKKIFPYYKASRAKSRSESSIDWNEFFGLLNQIRDEIRDHLPYKVIHLQGAEADDVIATLTKFASEKVMIVSSDHDFVQLQKYAKVEQFSPMTKKAILEANPIRALQIKILQGDTGDGVPNILSDDDTFVTEGKRQKPLTSKKIDQLLKDVPHTNSNFRRNRTMIDFTCIPAEIEKEILQAYEQSITRPSSNKQILNYLMEKRCSQLTQRVSDFFIN